MQLLCDTRGISHGGEEAGREAFRQSRSQRHQPAVRFAPFRMNKW